MTFSLVPLLILIIFTESAELNITTILAQSPIINKARFQNLLFYWTWGLDVFQPAKTIN